jgi:DNA mismatch repair protein MutS2
VSGLGIRGRVRSLDGSLAELEAQGKRLQVEVNALAVLEDADRLGPAKVEVAVQLGSTDEVGSELNVIGCRVDEAVARVEKFLDGALLAERRTVRVIHGQGTGQLRRAIAELLDGHVLVDRVATPPPEEGGRGVTVVELRA